MKKNKKETLKSKVKRDYLETSETQGKSEWRFPGFLFCFFPHISQTTELKKPNSNRHKLKKKSPNKILLFGAKRLGTA